MSTERGLDPTLERRLRAALDRVAPPASRPRYETAATSGLRAWRLAPVLVAVAAAMCLLALTGAAATRSPNPAIWSRWAATSIESVVHAPPPAPTGQGQRNPSPGHGSPGAVRQAGTAPTPTHDGGHESSPRPRPSERPDESPRPEPSGSPDPYHHRSEPSPTPSAGPEHQWQTSDFS